MKPLRKRKNKLWLALLLSVSTLAIFILPTLWFRPWSINHFYLRSLVEQLIDEPQTLSELRLLEPLGLDFHSDDLHDYSLAGQTRTSALIKRQRDMLHGYRRNDLDATEQESYDVMAWFLDDVQRGLVQFPQHDYAINQLSSVHVTLPDFMINTHQVNNARDARNFVERVRKFDAAFTQVIAFAHEQAAKNIVPPRFILTKVRADAASFIQKGVADNPMLKHFDGKIAALADLNAEERSMLHDSLTEVIRDGVLPAYNRYIEAVDVLLAKATDDAGVWKLPDGDDYYAYKLRSSTTTELTPAQVHALGLAEVDRIQKEMRSILDANGFIDVPFAQAMQKLYDDPRFQYPDTKEARKQILVDYSAIIDEIAAKTDTLFDLKPSIGVKVDSVPHFMEVTSPQAYYKPAPLDRSGSGIFFANVYDVRSHAKFTMRSLAYHEAIPGHHFQITIAQELEALPMFRRLIPFTAYVEGWALYAEQLAAEHGFVDDPFDRLGYLSAQIFRAARLVVDTGIHVQRWTREQAIDYMMKVTGMAESEVVAEVERYAIWPGQACGYMIGRIKILDQRERARKELGAAFSMKKFHDAVLGGGAVPLTILEQRVDKLIAGNRF